MVATLPAPVYAAQADWPAGVARDGMRAGATSASRFDDSRRVPGVLDVRCNSRVARTVVQAGQCWGKTSRAVADRRTQADHGKPGVRRGREARSLERCEMARLPA